jgi:muramoyltetrapeptide carboxypeptidase LdcA involved in peptidoglycan recycling
MPFNTENFPVEKITSRLISLGYDVVWSKYAFDNRGNVSSSIENRISDLYEGLMNDNYDIVMASVGGFNSNELLPHIDFEKVKSSRAVLIGMSDITTLGVNLFEKSGIRTVYGLNARSFIYDDDFSQFVEAINSNHEFKGFYKTQILPNKIFRNGKMEGRLVGGNLALLCWLAGTKYQMQVRDGDILFIEDDDETNGYYWQMYLNHLKQLGYFDKISGLVIGKVLDTTKFTLGTDFRQILSGVIGEYTFPVLVDADFGHIRNPISIPYGETYSLEF